MSRRQEAAVGLVVAVAAGALAQRAAAKQAEALGVPLLAVAVATWAVTRAIK